MNPKYCALGYNDVNNLVMQTLWLLLNKILRSIHKKDFPIFWDVSCAFAIKVLIRAIFFIFFIQYGYQKTQNFDFESVEKVLNKCTQKKLLAKTWRKYALFSLLIMFVKLVLLVTFSTDSKSAWNYAFLRYLFFIFKIFGSY